MNFRISTFTLMGPLLPVLAGLGGCLPETVLSTCARCGEISSIQPREVRGDPSLGSIVAGPIASAVTGAKYRPRTFKVYDVRVRMDRGGSRDITVDRLEDLDIGDRVEIREGRLHPA